jgi:hypothetical protein
MNGTEIECGKPSLKTITDRRRLGPSPGPSPLLVHCSFAWSQVDISSGKELDVSRNFASQPVPKWENCFLFGFVMDPPSAPRVYAYDQNGHKLFETPLALDSAVRIVPGPMAASRDGLFAVSGSAYSASGDGVVFVAVLDRTGRLVRVTRTGRFAPVRFCCTSDGTHRASGRPVTSPSEAPPDHAKPQFSSSHEGASEASTSQHPYAAPDRSAHSVEPADWHPAAKLFRK